jgi:hypothetical protein
MQKLLDRARAHNEEARQLAQAAGDLAAERRDLIAAFAELGIRQKKASGELVKLAVALTETAGFEVPKAAPAPDDWDSEPAAGEPSSPLAIPAELSVRKGTA